VTGFKLTLPFEEEVKKRLAMLEAGVGTFINASDGGPYIDSTYFSVSGNIGAAWESVGPTGGGADNTWTALDSVPTDVDWILVKFYAYASDNDTDSNYCLTYARRQGSSLIFGLTTMVNALRVGGQAGFVRYVGDVSFVYIPVNSAQFDLYFITNMDNETVYIYLAGYGYNS